MHTTPTTPTLADLQQTMIRVQIAALETLERCMTEPESTGNEKTDKAKSTERNRQRMAAAQALIHCRTMARELREAEAQTHRIAEENRQAGKKAVYERARLRRLHRQYPGEYDNPDAPGGMATQSVAMQSAEQPHTPEDIAMLRMAMPPEPSRVSPPSPLAGEGGDRSKIDRRMRGRPESSDRSECGMLKQRLSMSSPVPQTHAQTSLSMPHDPTKPIPTYTGRSLAAQIIAFAGTTQSLNAAP